MKTIQATGTVKKAEVKKNGVELKLSGLTVNVEKVGGVDALRQLCDQPVTVTIRPVQKELFDGKSAAAGETDLEEEE